MTKIICAVNFVWINEQDQTNNIRYKICEIDNPRSRNKHAVENLSLFPVSGIRNIINRKLGKQRKLLSKITEVNI